MFADTQVDREILSPGDLRDGQVALDEVNVLIARRVDFRQASLAA